MVKAIDVVLLPPSDITKKAIELNRSLENRKGAISLNETDCLPHISLAMGYIREENLPQVQKCLMEIAKEFLPIEIHITGASTHIFGIGDEVSGLPAEKTEKLQTLHETIMNTLTPFLEGRADASAFVSPEDILESTIQFIERYKKQSSCEHFDPHITLGLGKIKEDAIAPFSFTATTLAVCQLGKYCTCRKILILQDIHPET